MFTQLIFEERRNKQTMLHFSRTFLCFFVCDLLRHSSKKKTTILVRLVAPFWGWRIILRCFSSFGYCARSIFYDRSFGFLQHTQTHIVTARHWKIMINRFFVQPLAMSFNKALETIAAGRHARMNLWAVVVFMRVMEPRQWYWVGQDRCNSFKGDLIEHSIKLKQYSDWNVKWKKGPKNSSIIF